MGNMERTKTEAQSPIFLFSDFSVIVSQDIVYVQSNRGISWWNHDFLMAMARETETSRGFPGLCCESRVDSGGSAGEGMGRCGKPPGMLMN